MFAHLFSTSQHDMRSKSNDDDQRKYQASTSQSPSVASPEWPIAPAHAHNALVRDLCRPQLKITSRMMRVSVPSRCNIEALFRKELIGRSVIILYHRLRFHRRNCRIGSHNHAQCIEWIERNSGNRAAASNVSPAACILWKSASFDGASSKGIWH